MFAVGWGANQFSSLLVAYKQERGVSTSVADALFGYDAFLHGLGRMSLSTSLFLFALLSLYLACAERYAMQTSRLTAASTCSTRT